MIKPLTCPVCQQPVGPQASSSPDFPFCSERCRSIDLYRWSEGKYAIVEDIADRPDLLAKLLEEAEDLETETGEQADDDQ